MNKLGIIHPSDNTQVDIQRDVNGGALTVIRQPKMTTHFRVSRENAIGMGIAYLEAAGVPIQEAYARQKALENGHARQT